MCVPGAMCRHAVCIIVGTCMWFYTTIQRAVVVAGHFTDQLTAKYYRILFPNVTRNYVFDVSKLYKLNIILLVCFDASQIMFDVWCASQIMFDVWCLELRFNILQPSLILF